MIVGVTVMMGFSFSAWTQTNFITVTNFVTITNYVTVTNIVAAPRAQETSGTLSKTEAMTSTNAITQPVKHPWESSLGVGFSLTRGNSDTLLFTAGIQTHKKTPENEISFGVDGAYGENNSVANVNTVHGISQYNHLFSEKFYLYARTEALHDGIADLQYRINIGPGVGYYFLKETNTTFAGEFGSTYVTQRLGNEDHNYVTFRLAERFEYKFKKYGARVYENVEFLPQVNKFENYIINAEVGIETSITKTISLKTSLTDNFNNEPAAGRQKNDARIVSGVTYKF
ncbi:MAG: DUF481 domain-containing protein [Limisphaerales bacterium]